ncbi:MAG: NIL domain-containing protein [bacterium]
MGYKNMATKTIRTVFPKDLFQDPVIFTVGRISGVIPAITSARITEDSAEFVLHLEGTETQIEHAIRLLEEKGTVSPMNNKDDSTTE